jgi:hypothetical protein
MEDFHGMATTNPLKDTVLLTTPRGHEVTAELNYDEFKVRHAKVINNYTGVIRQLDAQTAETLERALRAKQVYEHALAESREVENTLKRFGHLTVALGESHPAVQPYVHEASQHKNIARDMFIRARQFHDDAMAAIDKLAD